MFPPDDILLARGKYSTLGKERRVQVERVRKVSETIQEKVYKLKASLETYTPDTRTVAELRRCVDSLEDAGSKLVALCEELGELHPIAWGDGNETEEVR